MNAELPAGTTRLTVTLVPKARAALEDAVAAEGLSRTDVINRALQLYGVVSGPALRGDLGMRNDDGELEIIRLL